MRLGLVIAFFLVAARAFADVSVSASVDRAHVGFGETVTYTITVQGSQTITPPAIPETDGLTIQGPSSSSNVSIINGQMNESISLNYEVTPTRQGEVTIPALEVKVGGKSYQTQPFVVKVDKPGAQTEFQDALFAKVQLKSQRLYLGQVAAANLLIFVRQNLPFKEVANLAVEADGLGYKYDQNIKVGSHVINGENFNTIEIAGAISPTRTGTMSFGPCSIKVHLMRNRRDQFQQMLYGPEIYEVPVSVEAVPIEVLPLPVEGRPADFHGAIGQWNLEVTAKPTDVAVGDPITLTVKIKGNGNIDTVPSLKLSGLEAFKTYDPTSKTTSDELHTQGERDFQQVLIARDTTISNVPAVHLSYFDPLAGSYKTAGHDSIPITVKPGAGGQITVVGDGHRAQPSATLGQGIVYLKGDLGSVPGGPLVGTPLFWALNVIPIFGLAGALTWKRRADRLTGDIAYARRSRAAREARKILATGASPEHFQRALQEYLGDRLNIPSSGITGSIVDEQLAPRGIDGTVATEIRRIFETCDAARFSGAAADATPLQQAVERVIDELEKINL